VRTALGPNVGIGLDVVRLGETTDQGQLVMLRARAPFTPLAAGVSPFEQIHVAGPVVLLHPPLRMSFAYAGPDRVFRVLSVSTVTPVHIDAPASGSKSGGDVHDDAKEADDKAGAAASKRRGS